MVMFRLVLICALLTGSLCQATGACETALSSLCFNGGDCTSVSGSPGYTCDCSSIDYEGDRCEIATDSCPTPGSADDCQNGGSCVDGDNTFTCSCLSGYGGNRCQNDINECLLTPSPCINGVCNNLDGSYNCTCDDGYEGPNCEDTSFDNCADDPCVNGGVCTDGYNEYICDCPETYSGVSCEIIPNNVTYYTSTSSGCACSDTDSTTQCACCVGGVSGCSCHSNVDSTICVLCSSDADQFLEWCQQPFVYYPPTVAPSSSRETFLQKSWPYFFAVGALAALIILIIIIVKAVKMYRTKSEKEALEKSIQREEARKNREFKSTGGKRTGGNSWAAWDSNNLMA